MGRAMFYHLTRRPLEVTLPQLIERSLHAGWRVLVRGTDAERLRWLDERLWLHPEDGFLPHGMAGGAHDRDQPVLLGTATARTNGAQCVMSIDGAEVSADEVAELQRVCILFDGHDAQAVTRARNQWRTLTAGGAGAQYWSEENGRWTMLAER